uniref:Uncharacterized protein n=1 Tax=Rhizophora mucronata TaxID=61149 RepID=A0A2P2MVQ6_RHIMU
MARQQSLTSLLTLMGAYREELEYTVVSNLINVTFSHLSFSLYFTFAFFICLHSSYLCFTDKF